jgi:Flp pilus assembly protein TadG
MRKSHKPVRNRKGFVSIYIVFSAFLLIPMAGLAIDMAVLYGVQARLQTAVDAAALGSGNTLNRNAVMDVNAVKDAAQRFFNANYPAHYWGTAQLNYNADPEQGTLGTRTITITATEQVPMLFLRVLGINSSQVGANAQVTVRFVNVMVVVDRSGSVFRASYNGVPTRTIVANDLHAFVSPSDGSASPYFSDGRDYVGLLTFGASWRLDFALTQSFQSASPNIGAAIDAIDWNTNNSTNTAEGLFHGYRQLVTLSQPGALNVIVLLTDGRPSAFSGSFAVSSGSSCTNKTNKIGVMDAPVGQPTGSTWPPPTTGTTTGILQSQFKCNGCENTNLALNSTNCSFAGNTNNVSSDIPNFPSSVAPPDDNPLNLSFFTTQATNSDLTAFTGAGTTTSSPRAVRFASFNVADNIATMIRTDTNINPVIYVIGLNNNNGEEPLDADWLARVANDIDYLDVNGNHVYQSGQAQGKYYNVNAGGIGAALADIASQILRLTK